MGLSPTRGVVFIFVRLLVLLTTDSVLHCASVSMGNVLVAQLDKASDYESEDWGFKSLQGYIFAPAL